MKPLPEAVQLAFPAAYGHLPDRPWWRHEVTPWGHYAPCYRRPRSPALTVEEIAAYDAAHPLPHPGYRAGQVWANERGHSVAVLAAALGEVATNTREWSEKKFAKAYPYLMFDGACPHLAPWSPTEKTP